MGNHKSHVGCFIFEATQTTTGNASGSCVNSCRYQGGCSYNYACNGLSQIGGERIGLCLPKGGAVTGSTCTTNNSCEFGYCSNGICSRDCTGDGVCPAGLTCVDGGTPTIEGLPFRRCRRCHAALAPLHLRPLTLTLLFVGHGITVNLHTRNSPPSRNT